MPEFSRTEVGAELDDCQRSAQVLWSALRGICSLANAEKLDVVATQSAGQMAALLISTYMAGLRANRGAGGPHAG